MKAVRIYTPGDAGVLCDEDVALPEPGPGQARVKVDAAGLNFIDIYQRLGLYPLELPQTLGMEAAGTVDAVGAGVDDVAAGDYVAYAMQLGAYAEYAVVPASKLVPVPDTIPPAQAAATMLQGMTAHYLTHSTYPLQPGDTALVHAAAGGVGQLLVQLAKHRGARVIGTVSTEEKAALAKAAGADEVVGYTETDFETEARRLTDGEGVHVVYDSVGRDTFEKSLRSLRPRGTLVLYGQSSGPVGPLDLQELAAGGSLFVTRPTLGHYVLSREELLERCTSLFEWIANGTLNLRIDRTFPLSEAADAHRYMEGRHTKGKVLLIP